jgi:atypical dual specificity phosphatase
MVDEPTAGLAREQADQVLLVLAALARRRAVLVVLHNLREARQLARRVVLIAGGRLQEAGDAQGFFLAPATDSGKHFLASGSCPEPAIAPREPQSALPRPSITATAPASPPSAACGPRGFVWLLPGQLAGTPWPGIIHGADYDLQLLASVGVTRLVALTEEPFDARLAAPFGIQCASYPMPDMHPPSRAQAYALCRELDTMLAAGEVVAVHCRAGLGRTGTVLACYWLWRASGTLNAVRALEDVRRLEPGWVQSQAQVSFLETFAAQLAPVTERADT